MIKANELMIGNWVLWNEDETYMRIGASSFLLPEVRFDPIPLTPEILKECGFEEEIRENEETIMFRGPDNDIPITQTFKHITWWNSIYLSERDTKFYFNTGIEIKYVHQLQNLYFALTREELKINLNVEAVNG